MPAWLLPPGAVVGNVDDTAGIAVIVGIAAIDSAVLVSIIVLVIIAPPCVTRGLTNPSAAFSYA